MSCLATAAAPPHRGSNGSTCMPLAIATHAVACSARSPELLPGAPQPSCGQGSMVRASIPMPYETHPADQLHLQRCCYGWAAWGMQRLEHGQSTA